MELHDKFSPVAENATLRRRCTIFPRPWHHFWFPASPTWHRGQWSSDMEPKSSATHNRQTATTRKHVNLTQESTTETFQQTINQTAHVRVIFRPTELIKVSHHTRHKIGHFRDILPSQSFDILPKKLNLTQRKHIYTNKLQHKIMTKSQKAQSNQQIVRSVHACIALCTIVVHNMPTAQNRPDNFLSYPPDNYHCSDDVYLREGGTPTETHIHTQRFIPKTNEMALSAAHASALVLLPLTLILSFRVWIVVLNFIFSCMNCGSKLVDSLFGLVFNKHVW